MDPTVQINERVEIIATYHISASDTHVCFPRKMRFRNQEITFTTLGMRHPTQKGKRMIHVFEVSDESNDYRLEYDAERLTWTLVSMLEGHYVRQS